MELELFRACQFVKEIKQFQREMLESGTATAGSQETDGMLCPESRPRTVTCISAPGETSPGHSNNHLQRSKSVRCRNQVVLLITRYHWLTSHICYYSPALSVIQEVTASSPEMEKGSVRTSGESTLWTIMRNEYSYRQISPRVSPV